VTASGEDRCAVTSGAGADVVLGILGQSALDGKDDARAVNTMRAGPATCDPTSTKGDLLGRMHTRSVVAILVTDPEGDCSGSSITTTPMTPSRRRTKEAGRH